MTPKKGSNEQRNAKREKVFLVGAITHDERTSRVHVLNVSTTGALLHAASPPVVNDSVTLTVARSDIAGEVAWSTPTLFGVKFEKPISATSVEAILPG